jgi:hypothetical protein
MAKILYKKVKSLSKEKAAYLAGLIDGEGTITLSYKQKNAERHLAVTISNTEHELLLWTLKAIGAGKITSKKTYSTKHTPSYTYQVYNQQALSLLKQIVPYLKTSKKKRAKLVIDNYTKLTPRNGKYSEKLLYAKHQFEKEFFEIKPNIRLKK